MVAAAAAALVSTSGGCQSVSDEPCRSNNDPLEVIAGVAVVAGYIALAVLAGEGCGCVTHNGWRSPSYARSNFDLMRDSRCGR